MKLPWSFTKSTPGGLVHLRVLFLEGHEVAANDDDSQGIETAEHK